MRRFLAVMMVAGAFSLLAPAQSSLGLIQPDAGLAFGIEWNKIVASPLGSQLTDELNQADLPKIPGLRESLQSLVHGLDSVLIASSASGLGKGVGQTPPVLVIVKGRFNRAQLRSLVMGKAQSVETYRSVELLAAPASAPTGSAAVEPDKNRLAFLDDNTILAGDRGEVRAAIDRVKSGRLTKAAGGMLGGIAELSSNNDIWMSLQLPANAMKDAPPAMSEMLAGLKSTELGMSFQQGLGIHLNIRTKDDASAKNIAQAMQGLLAMAALSQDKPGQQSAEMLKKIQIAPENSMVKLTLALDQSELQKIINEAKAGRAMSVASAPKPTAAAIVPAPSGPKTVRITGLDNGPVEVPLSVRNK